jgi:4-hydroxythreonine-4-phosphate dehydrogenase
VFPKPNIAITCGEPAGIGPDLCVLLAAKLNTETRAQFTFIGNIDALKARAELRGAVWADVSQSANIKLINLETAAPVLAGKLDPRNGAHVLATLDAAIEGCQSGEYAAMVTAPLNKAIINDYIGPQGSYFSGHTEYLAEKTNTAQVVMMLTGDVSHEGESAPLRVALATTHLPLKDVSAAITIPTLTLTLEILYADLQHKFGLSNPKIIVAGLNPHAGENGYLGREEIDVIVPVITALKARGMQLIGPLPADTLFNPNVLKGADAVLAMYHDQGLPVLKYATFGRGINVTLGLPIIRTSPDHGTAIDLAGKGDIDCGSMWAAIDCAIKLAKSNSRPC